MKTTQIVHPLRFLAVAAIAVVAPAAFLWSQSFSTIPSSAQKPDVDDINPSGANFSSFSVSNGHASPGSYPYGTIDNSIDEKSYFVGGGDVFLISLLDMGTRVYTGTVNQNCDLNIPSVGIMPLGKVPLAQAKERIIEFVKAKLRKSEGIYVSLQKVKSATVCVSGSVFNPGTYELPGTMRLWDAIKTASKEEPREKRTSPDLNEYDFRSVRCRYRDSVETYDLFAFLYKGDLSQNPYVYPGDQITLFPTTRWCYIGGEVKGTLKGMVPIREAESARGFLSLFALSEQADSEAILVQHVQDDGTYRTMTLGMKSGQDISLRGGDIITVPPRRNDAEILVAVVTGEVARPGMYPIARGETQAQSIITLAGGYSSYANTDKAVVIRRNKIPVSSPTEPVAKPEPGAPMSVVRPELSSSLSMMYSTKDFSIIRIKDHPTTVLEPWDQVLVPRAEKVVYVSGNVKRPGGYPYKEGENREYYLHLAGGLTSKANRSNIYIVAMFNEIMQTFDRPVVEDGDIIIVPTSQEYKRLSTLVLPILNAAIGTLALIIAIIPRN